MLMWAAFDGDTVEEFRNWSKVAFDPEWEWGIYAFDINPKFQHNWKKKSDEHTKFELKAAWIYDGEVEVAIDKTKTPLGSTIMSGKKAIWDKYPKVKVPCFDFSQWLKQFKDNYVVVKFDCEGAEYVILDKMIEDETILIPKKLMVEFHPNKVREYTTTYTNEFKQKIRDMGVDLVDWH